MVISIITLLIALLLPALHKAKLAGWAVQCLSNERQIGIALHLYTLDNEDLLPYSTECIPTPGPVNNPKNGWFNAIGEYMRFAHEDRSWGGAFDNPLYVCPVMEHDGSAAKDLHETTGGYLGVNRVDYGVPHDAWQYNNKTDPAALFMTTHDKRRKPQTSAKLGEVKSADVTYMAMDCQLGDKFGSHSFVSPHPWVVPPFSPTGRHLYWIDQDFDEDGVNDTHSP